MFSGKPDAILAAYNVASKSQLPTAGLLIVVSDRSVEENIVGVHNSVPVSKSKEK